MEAIPSRNMYAQMRSLARLARRAYRPYKAEIAILALLSLIGGLLEGIGINAVIPLLTFVLGLQSPATDVISQVIQALFEWARIPFVPRYLLAFIVTLFLGKAVVTFILGYIQSGITTEYERNTRSKLFQKVMAASWPYLLRQKLGNLETLLIVDTPASMSLLVKISFTVTLLTSLLMYLVVAFSISWSVTVTTLGLGILVFVTLRPLLDRVHKISRERSILYRDMMHHVTEHIGGLKTVKALGVEDAAVERGEHLFARIKGFARRILILHQLAAQAVTPIGVIYIASILALAFKTPFISPAALPPILYLIYRVFTYVQQLQNNVQYMSELAPHLERVVRYEDEAEARADAPSGNSPFRFSKELSFKNVSFAYEKDRDVLRDVSFKVLKGSMVGIVGPSGAGKTTCVDLVLRLLIPRSGIITVDGIESENISLQEWRQNIAYVSQDPFLIQDTIRNNIRFYDDSITDEEVWDAARKAHIDEYIRKSPRGLDTMVGERGVQLSAGERQRIVIARALARKPEILILDEATSALDNESEAHIKRVIEELKGKVTVVAIAHRLSTIMGSDSIIVLHNGGVVETGSPRDLLLNPNSYFYKVFSISQ